jgi:hypothetical protein
MLSRKRNDQIAMHCRRRAAGHKQAAVRPPCERRDGTLDLAGITRIDRTQFHPEKRLPWNKRTPFQIMPQARKSMRRAPQRAM